ncbi:TPA: hypothetical protein JG832_002405 [Enterobacter hormaechei subsp. xiangfangensis]|nr:hypothetical protein [Enterobacter hormaechei subsp. xiangfangensis]HAV1890543.1 hypothetical protein [Enterobacter hormaechei subsp. xiangfangensis]
MQYIPTLNYMCARHNRDICQAIIDACSEPVSRKSLGKRFAGTVDSSKLSRLLFEMKRIDVLDQNDDRDWMLSSRVKYNASGLPFQIVPVDGICAQILRLFGSQYIRRARLKTTRGQFNVVSGPPASLTIKSLQVVLGVSREVLQLRLTRLLDAGLIKRKTSSRPYSYQLSLMEDDK